MKCCFAKEKIFERGENELKYFFFREYYLKSVKINMIKNFLLDLIFPRFCLGCRKELSLKQASFICEVCLNKIPLNTVTCHICGLRNNVGVPKEHRRCRKKTNLSGVFSAGKYRDPILREAIHQFKYQSAESLKKPLAELLFKYLKKENLPAMFANSFLTPIPLTRRRKLSRGFNQSELLAVEISKYLNLSIVNLLKRKKIGAPQAQISDWKQRKENISGAFIINRRFVPFADDRLQTVQIKNYKNVKKEIKKVILVDDVATSGATLEEAARVLREAGVKEVYGLVVAGG